VLVTGLAADEDRRRGMDAGADAYIVKSGFDQASLLETVGQLIGEP
jgi:two-component system, chemotaxis family, sensor kinase CheA